MSWRKSANALMQTYWRLSRSLTMGAQGIVIDAEDRVLLIRHGYRPGWHFPGGGVERNESVMTALERELEEETGVRMSAPPELIGLFTNFAAFPSDHIALFIVRNWTRPIIPPPTREIAEAAFFPWKALPEGVVAPVRRRLAELFNGAPRSDTW